MAGWVKVSKMISVS